MAGVTTMSIPGRVYRCDGRQRDGEDIAGLDSSQDSRERRIAGIQITPLSRSASSRTVEFRTVRADAKRSCEPARELSSSIGICARQWHSVKTERAVPDPDVSLDLSRVFATTYERGRYARRLRYEAPPPAPLSHETAAWVSQMARTINDQASAS